MIRRLELKRAKKQAEKWVHLAPIEEKKFYVMKAISAYRIFREEEVEARLNDGWEIIDGPVMLEYAKEKCIEELEMQILSAKDEILEAEEYTGELYPELKKLE